MYRCNEGQVGSPIRPKGHEDAVLPDRGGGLAGAARSTHSLHQCQVRPWKRNHGETSAPLVPQHRPHRYTCGLCEACRPTARTPESCPRFPHRGNTRGKRPPTPREQWPDLCQQDPEGLFAAWASTKVPLDRPAGSGKQRSSRAIAIENYSQQYRLLAYIASHSQ